MDELEALRQAVREGAGDGLVEALGAERAAEHDDDGAARLEAEGTAAGVARDLPEARIDGPADDAVAVAVAALDGIGEEHPPRERRREAVREAEVRVGLAEHARDAERGRGREHRAGDVAARAVDDVRAHRAQDRQAARRRDEPTGGRARRDERRARARPETRNGWNG